MQYYRSTRNRLATQMIGHLLFGEPATIEDVWSSLFEPDYKLRRACETLNVPYPFTKRRFIHARIAKRRPLILK